MPRLLRVIESAVRAYDTDRALEVLDHIRAELGIAEQADAPALGIVRKGAPRP
jgi:hypothetical protein